MDYIHQHASNSQSFGWRACVIVEADERGLPALEGVFNEYWFTLGPFVFRYKEATFTDYVTEIDASKGVVL